MSSFRKLLNSKSKVCPVLVHDCYMFKPSVRQTIVGMGHTVAGPFKYHGDNTVLQHTCDVMSAVMGDELAVFLAFVHDIGKIYTPEDVLPHHIGHDTSGKALMTLHRIVEEERLPLEWFSYGRFVITQHMRVGHNFEHMKMKKKLKVWEDVRQLGIEKQFFAVVCADSKNPLSHYTLDEDK